MHEVARVWGCAVWAVQTADAVPPSFEVQLCQAIYHTHKMAKDYADDNMLYIYYKFVHAVQ